MSRRPNPLGSITARARLLAGAVAILGAALLLLSPYRAAAQEVFTPAEAVSLPKGEKVTDFGTIFDEWTIELMFLADQTNKVIDVIDTSDTPTQHTVIKQLAARPGFAGAGGANPAIAGPNGVVTVPTETGRELWVSDYDAVNREGVVKVIDLNSGETTHVIPTGGVARAGALCYDPNDNVLLVANDSEGMVKSGRAPFDSLISTVNYEVLHKIRMNGRFGRPLATNGIGQCQWDQNSGNFFQNIPEVGGNGTDSRHGDLLEISPQSLHILARFKIPKSLCDGPEGIALGPAGQALLGCADPSGQFPSSVVVSLADGAVLNTLPGEDGAGEVWFDPNHGEGFAAYFLAISRAGTTGKLGVVDAASGEQPSYPTAIGAHSVAVDTIFDEVYVPIPSTGGTNICSSVAISPGVDANGCIMVFTN